MATRALHGTGLYDGYTVMMINDLKVKGASKRLKRGWQVKNIRLVANADQVECRIGNSAPVFNAAFIEII